MEDDSEDSDEDGISMNDLQKTVETVRGKINIIK